MWSRLREVLGGLLFALKHSVIRGHHRVDQSSNLAMDIDFALDELHKLRKFTTKPE